LAPEDLPLCILALRASALEFARSWGEFCVAAPGAIESYGASVDHLSQLADRLASATA
jgi:hypothetical protein